MEVFMWFILIISLFFATPVFAQDITADTIQERIQKLEQEKSQLEAIYREITVRIDELRQLMAPKKEEQPTEDK